MAILAKESGLDGVVCSPQEAFQLRQVCGENFLLVCPGVRPKWANLGDQKRVMTPQEAIKQGADLLVIGRPITQAENPQLAWKKINDLSFFLSSFPSIPNSNNSNNNNNNNNNCKQSNTQDNTHKHTNKQTNKQTQTDCNTR